MKIAQIHTETYGMDFWDVILLVSLNFQLSQLLKFLSLAHLPPVLSCLLPTDPYATIYARTKTMHTNKWTIPKILQ